MNSRFFLCLCLCLCLCNVLYSQDNFYPTKHPDVPQEMYERTISTIRNFYENLEIEEKKGNILPFSLATCYARLKSPPQRVYNELNKIFRLEDRRRLGRYCNFITRISKYKESKGELLEVKEADTIKWEKFCERCQPFIEEYKKAKEVRTLTTTTSIDISMKQKLNNILEKDQYFRKQLGKEELDSNELMNKQEKLDEENLKEIEELFFKEGYPKVKEIGREAAAIPFIVIQHSPKESQIKWFPFLADAMKEGDINPATFILLVDRIHHWNFGTQLYGTQSNGDGVPFEHPNDEQEYRICLGKGEVYIGRIKELFPKLYPTAIIYGK